MSVMVSQTDFLRQSQIGPVLSNAVFNAQIPVGGHETVVAAESRYAFNPVQIARIA